MKLEIKGDDFGELFVDGKQQHDPCPKVVAELARRVNGWDRMVAALKGMLSPPENGGDVLEKIKFARAALKEAGE